jgi:hypothetical protein
MLFDNVYIDILKFKDDMMYSFNSKEYAYDDIDCSLVVCQKCFWTATIFRTARKEHSQNMSACPICSCKNISTFSILIHDNNNNINE